MKKLKVELKNCYGIAHLEHEFDFRGNKPKAYAVYAPNGLMKSSFAKTFEALASGESPKEERFNRPSTCLVQADGSPISKEDVYVLKSEIDISSDGSAITNILVNPAQKARYDELLVDLEKMKSKLIASLQKASKVKKGDIEGKMLADWGQSDFAACVEKIKGITVEEDLSAFEYATIFDPKAIEVLKSKEFAEKADEFNQRYQELFNQAGTVYLRGVFNPARAEASIGALSKQGFFAGGHRVHLRGDANPVDETELRQKLDAINARIDADEGLKKLRENLAKNAQTLALTDLIEKLSSHQVEYLLEKLKPENQDEFRQELWAFYVQASPDASPYVTLWAESKEEIKRIEIEATQAVPTWTNAVELFNSRFVDMPFTLSVANQAEAALGKDKAKLKFTFKDGADIVEWSRSELKTLSQGEKRALYLLNFIFEVEARKLATKETVFIIDDIADSFDYKNKHAIVQYLRDVSRIEHFHQIVLTHNFDFYRTLNLTFVPYERCLMANKAAGEIILTKADGVRNYFIGKWKDNVTTDDCILCATIPFSRNLIEYTKGSTDRDYLQLTSLLHWKRDTAAITVGDYIKVYNRLFGTSYDTGRTEPLRDVLFREADEICTKTTQPGLILEDKVVLSIAIRMKAEVFLVDQIRGYMGQDDYWCEEENQFRVLNDQYASYGPPTRPMATLDKVSITVSSNIHLNSFMYEPILDLSVEHLKELYREVESLSITPLTL